MKIVVVGGVAGGATVSARLRRLSEKSQIIILERDGYISYANCGLPYFVGNVISDKSKLLLQSVMGMKSRYNIEVRTLHEVVSIDKVAQIISVLDLATGKKYTETYDKLILSTGSQPIVPKLVGIDTAKNIFTVRGVDDSVAIKSYIKSNNVKRAVVVGGGFIGVEMADNLANLGINVILVEKMPQVLRQLDFEMAQLVHIELANNAVNLVLNDGVAELSSSGKIIKLESGKIMDTDIVILAIGVVPETTLPKTCNLRLGKRNHVIVNDNFCTMDSESGLVEPNIFAIGDMIEVVDSLDDTFYAVPLAWGANRQARLLADYISGIKIKPSKIQGTSVLSIFDITVATTGSNESTLIAKGIQYIAAIAHRPNHATYYPNAANIVIKILFDPSSGRIFGAQAVGKEGTDKRIDVIATVMRLGGSILDLSDLQLCYAPKYSSAKDPVNILGYIGENILRGDFSMVSVKDIDAIVARGALLIDVRTISEFANGHIEGAINIELDSLRNNLSSITAQYDTPIYINCQVGQRAYLAIKILSNNGYTNLYNVSGGYSTYKAYKYCSKSNL